MKKRLYISGAITKDPDFARKFRATADWIREHGGLYYNPAGHAEIIPDASWCEYMQISHSALQFFCDGLVFMPGAEYSAGAQMELYWAQGWRKQIYLDDSKGESDELEKTMRYLQTHAMSFSMLSAARLEAEPEEEGEEE